jgi:glucosamine-6-phosphate deaminase
VEIIILPAYEQVSQEVSGRIVSAVRKNPGLVLGLAKGPVSASCPASILQFHRNTKIIIDQEAASLLKRKDYYLWVWKHKNEVYDVIKEKK